MAESYAFLQPLLERANPVASLRIPSEIPQPRLFKVDGAKLILYGRQVGSLSFDFVAAHEPLLQQSLVGVTSEEGVKAFSPIVHFGRSDGPSNAQAEVLRTRVSQFMSLALRTAAGPSADSAANHKELRQHLTFLEQTLSSKAQTRPLPSYSKPQDLLDMQIALADGAEALLQLATRVPKRLEEQFFGCLNALLERQEFLLQNFLASRSAPGCGPQANRTAIRFHGLLTTLLHLDFDFFEERNLSAAQKSFTEYLFVFLFFRVAEFRSLILQLVDGRPRDPREERLPPQLQQALDWNGLLFDHLTPSDPDLAASKQRQSQALSRNWKEIINRKSAFFYTFLGQFVLYASSRLPIHDQLWEEIPGYQVLTTELFRLLWEKSVSGCAEAMMGPCFSVLKNPQMIDRFLSVLVEKTVGKCNNMDSPEIVALFRILRRTFAFLQTERIPVAVVVNIHAILNLLIGMMESDNVQALVHALHFLAAFGETLSAQAMRDFAKMIVKFFFYRLFLHWHESVRTDFLHFLFQKAVLPADRTPGKDADQMLLKINANANLVAHAADLYDKKRRKWEELPRSVKVNFDFCKMRAEIAREAHETFPSAGGKTNLLACSPRFTRVSSEPMVSELPDLESLEPPTLRKALESEKSIRKVHNYQNLLKGRREDRIQPDSLPYCAGAVNQFKILAARYAREKSFASEIFSEELTQSRVMTAIDHFESKGDD